MLQNKSQLRHQYICRSECDSNDEVFQGWLCWSKKCNPSVSWLFLHRCIIHLHVHIFISFSYCHVDYFLIIIVWSVVCCSSCKTELQWLLFLVLRMCNLDWLMSAHLHIWAAALFLTELWGQNSSICHATCNGQDIIMLCFLSVGLQDLILHKMWYCQPPEFCLLYDFKPPFLTPVVTAKVFKQFATPCLSVLTAGITPLLHSTCLTHIFPASVAMSTSLWSFRNMHDLPCEYQHNGNGLDDEWNIYAVQQDTQSFFNVWVLFIMYVSSACFGPHWSIFRCVFYRLYVQIWYVVVRILLDTSSHYEVVGPKHVELTYMVNKTQSLKNFVYLVGLHIYYKMIHGHYNIMMNEVFKE